MLVRGAPVTRGAGTVRGDVVMPPTWTSSARSGRCVKIGLQISSSPGRRRGRDSADPGAHLPPPTTSASTDLGDGPPLPIRSVGESRADARGHDRPRLMAAHTSGRTGADGRRVQPPARRLDQERHDLDVLSEGAHGSASARRGTSRKRRRWAFLSDLPDRFALLATRSRGAPRLSRERGSESPFSGGEWRAGRLLNSRRRCRSRASRSWSAAAASGRRCDSSRATQTLKHLRRPGDARTQVACCASIAPGRTGIRRD